MKKVVGVKFKDNGSTYEFLVGNLKTPKNVTVIVDTENGEQFGKVVTEIYEVEDDKRKFKKVKRISTKQDYLAFKKNKTDAEEAILVCKKIVNDLNLKMQVVDAEFLFDRSQLIFRFVSNSRIDFRMLVKELASVYKTRIELRQIGSRDKAKEIGGIGLCGREICCSKCLKNFNTVSIAMAKNQNISLNPEKINGVCGRLLCCLKYEDDIYTECKKSKIKIGDIVNLKEGTGTVTNISCSDKTYDVTLKNGKVIIKNMECCNGNIK